ncbi:hypothetical protein FHG87_017086, partial [Trinorchestia longiramus]
QPNYLPPGQPSYLLPGQPSYLPPGQPSYLPPGQPSYGHHEEEVVFTFELSNKNTYSYTVNFTVQQTNATNQCIDSIKLQQNDSCSCIPESCDEELKCVFEHFAVNMKQTVIFSTLVMGKEGCQSPLQGIASFSKLPFNIFQKSVVSASSFTLRELEKWYEQWWGILLITLIVVVVVLNIVIVVVYRFKKADEKKKETSEEVKNEAGNEELATEDGGDNEDEDDMNAVQPLNPDKNNP